MNSIQLGKRLKEARLGKKMTQSDVVGTFITRNMLSQIESGAASPSLRTLEYLANTLEIPMHYLIAEDDALSAEELSLPCNNISDNDFVSLPLDTFLKCKSAYLRGDFGIYASREAYAEALKLLDELLTVNG